MVPPSAPAEAPPGHASHFAAPRSSRGRSARAKGSSSGAEPRWAADPRTSPGGSPTSTVGDDVGSVAHLGALKKTAVLFVHNFTDVDGYRFRYMCVFKNYSTI